ncbi:hypothetical protein ABMA28_010759 [Loxostege sticticalis]|uniref:Uncharacterized protein n=1 Tax=Loxostege sticticalis TaxID=481309 RepID=A0ABD0S9C8_LOXSC
MEYKMEEGKPIADITPINSIAPTLLTRKLKDTKPRAWQRSTTPKALTNNMKIINTTALNLLGKQQHPNHHNKKNRLKTFIGKNKQLFQDFLHKKQLEAQKQKEAQVEKVKLRWKIDDTEASDDKSEQVRKKAARQRASSLESGVLKAELLDMAPAKGGQLHHQRIKGRLCQRHVLIPEGPKYNSRGEMYVPAYGHRAGRDYVHSPRPKFVLPRCCNCCRKSLLGCE